MTDRDDRDDRIESTPMRHLSGNVIRGHGPVQLMAGAAPDGHGITVGFLFSAPAPIGEIEWMLTGDQLQDLYNQLHHFMNLSPEDVEALRVRLQREAGP